MRRVQPCGVPFKFKGAFMLDKILNIDCLEGMKNIENNSIDLIICDLPYGVTDCSWDSVIPFDELWEQYRRILKPGGVCCLFCSQPFTTDVINSNRRWFKYCWYWDKVGSTGFGFAKYQPMRRIEEIAVFYKPVNGRRTEKYRYYPDVRPTDRKRKHKPPRDGVYRDSLYSGNHGECFTGYPDNVIRISSRGKELASGKRLHPTQKPLDLLEFLIKIYSQAGDIVLDNCAGSGSTLVAAMRTGRHFIGMEKDEHYFSIAAERLEAERENLNEGSN